MMQIIPGVMRLNGYRSTYAFVARYIKNEFLRRFLSFHPLLIGGSPFNTPAIYTLIVQFEKEWGVHYGIGGTGAIVDGLGKLFKDLNGSIYLNTPVREILVSNGRVSGIRKDKRKEFYNQLVKMDLTNQRTTVWYKEGVFPGEPIFIKKPNARQQDEGVLLSVMLDEKKGQSFLCIINAMTMEEIARAYVPHAILFGYHGIFDTRYY
jgi:phytoene dehydrogenase-like protein